MVEAVCYYSGAIVIGMFIGIFLMAFMYIFTHRVEQVKFRRYFTEITDGQRIDIVGDLDDAYAAYNKIAKKTNTMLFKRKANSLIDLMVFLEKYRVN